MIKQTYKFRLCLVILNLSFIFTSLSQITNVRKWRKSERDSLANILLVYDDGKLAMAYPVMDKLYHAHPKENFVKYVYAKCALTRSDKYEEAYTALSEVYANNHKIAKIEYDLARAAHFTNRFDVAMEMVNKFIARKSTKPEEIVDANHLKRYIQNAIHYTSIPTSAKITNLGDHINTETDEYVPTITADETVMIFTHRGPKAKGEVLDDNQKPEDVYMTVKQDDQYITPYPIDSINTDVHDAAISLSHDGQILFIYRDNGDDHGDIYQSFLIGESFSKPYKLRGDVNSYSWDGHCSLSPDGQTLYFSSERAGGYGGKDIYKATLLPDSTWGKVTNLGDSINTVWDDDAPFIHPDGITLYYSSKGKTSMGGYDIFESTMGVDSTFKITEHLGYPINSTDDDIYFVLSALGNNGYYSSGKRGGFGMKDIYLIQTNFTSSHNLYLVKGKTTVDKAPVAANIKVEVSSRNNSVFRNFKSNIKTGQYLITLPPGAEYKITYSYPDKVNDTYTLSTIDIKGYSEKIHDVAWDVIDTTKIIISPTIAITPTFATIPVNDVDDSWIAKTKMQEKIMRYVKKYKGISAEGLDFRVQIAAFKYPKNYKYTHLKNHGKVENLLLDDGITRITIGGKFKTINEAWDHNKKVIKAGQEDAFVTAIYNGKRVLLEELEKMGIFVTK